LSGQSITAAANNNRSRHHRRGKPVQEFSDNFALDRKIKEAIKGLKPSPQYLLLGFSDEDKELIADFILDWSNHITAAVGQWLPTQRRDTSMLYPFYLDMSRM
jgi:hypothetical protein